MSLFDLTPKDSPKSLYGRDEELDQLVRLVHRGRWVAVLGPRMVGKTSLVKAANRRVDRPAVYVNLWGARGTLGFMQAFVHGLNSSRGVVGQIRDRLRRIDGISVGTRGIAVSVTRRPLKTVWDLLDVIGAELGRSLIELDEVQELAASSGTILRLLANVFNTHPDVAFVFTGSRFGLLRTLLEPTGDSPLLGRSPAALRLDPFSPERSVGFLEAGFKEFRMASDQEQLRALVDRSLDGIPGWLALYGNHVAVQRLAPGRAESLTVEEGAKVAASELTHFLESRDARTYLDALRLLATGATWTELRDHLSVRRGSRVNDNTIRNLLGALRDADLVIQRDDRYLVPDPMMRAFVVGARARRRAG